MFWRYCDDVMAMLLQYVCDALVILWQSLNSVAMCRWCCGHVLVISWRIQWRCFGDIVAICWSCCGDVVAMCWGVILQYVLAILWEGVSAVSTMCWGCGHDSGMVEYIWLHSSNWMNFQAFLICSYVPAMFHLDELSRVFFIYEHFGTTAVKYNSHSTHTHTAPNVSNESKF